MSERHIHSDPPDPRELQELSRDVVCTTLLEGLPSEERAPVTRAIAVAGTATSAAAIDQELDPYDPARVHGYPLMLGDRRTAARPTRRDDRRAAPRAWSACTPIARPRSSPG